MEDFDSYDNEAELQSVYSPSHSTKSNLTLVDIPEDNGTKAGNIHYDFVSYPEYNGFQRSHTPKQDWSGFSKLNMFLKADGSDHKFVVQVNAGGVTFEAYPKIDGTDGHVVSLNFGDADGNGGDFAPASWDTAHAGMKLSQKLLSKVGSFALYINDNGGNRPKSGDLTLDSIKLDGKRDAYAPNTNPTPGNTAKAQSVDDFSGYSDDAAAQSAWGNRGHTEVYPSMKARPMGPRRFASSTTSPMEAGTMWRNILTARTGPANPYWLSKSRGMVPTTPSACRSAQAMANTSSPASNLTSPAGSRLRFHWSITPI